MVRRLIVLIFVLLAGCASYSTPGGPVRLAELAGNDADAAARQPAPQFPVKLGVIRVQAPAYRSYSSAGVGRGSFSVLTSPDDPLSGSLQQALSQWPAITGVTPLDPELLPTNLTSLDDLRLAAAKMQVDILLVYTIDTHFHINGHDYGPLAEIPLKTVPDADASVSAVASAAFVDVRTGYRYGSSEAAAQESGLRQVWGTADAIDAKRIDAEQKTVAMLSSEAKKTWQGIALGYH